jgi:lipoate-protein ligase A
MYHYLYIMLCLHPIHHDPFYNLAAEEYFLRNSGEEFFMLWQSDPVVVVGKHQNTLAEINYRFTRSNQIPVARRLTGGGTVYHDRGNINFSFIRQGVPGKLVDFGSFITPVINFLKTLGIDATHGEKNEILVKGKKISGNAEHVYKNRVLHHGTLLYHANMDMLHESIKPGSGKYTDRAVQSNRSKVMNLVECLNPPISILEFCEKLMHFIRSHFNGHDFVPGMKEQEAIQKLAVDKYRTWEWIFGWSPDYTFHGVYRTGDLRIASDLTVHRGMITECVLQSAGLPEELLEIANAKLTGTLHEENNIRERLVEMGFTKIFHQKDLDDLVLSFF